MWSIKFESTLTWATAFNVLKDTSMYTIDNDCLLLRKYEKKSSRGIVEVRVETTHVENFACCCMFK